MTRAVIYARYSSSTQREESIEGQLRVCNSYAESMGFTVVDTYIDRAMSATTDHRPDFQRMIADSGKHLFDAVLLYSLDRFARSRYDSAHYKMLLRKNGVKVYYANNSIPDSPEGIILESVMEGLAEYYSVELSTKIKRGLMENVLHGKVAGSSAPFGYVRSEDGKFVAEPTQRKIVIEIYQMYADGYCGAEIARTLNDRGIRTSKGAKWNKSSFKTILSNRKYLGEYSYNGVVVPDACEPIVSPELFERVQQKLRFVNKTKAHNKASEEYLLSGKLFCGKCGNPMNGESGTSKTGTLHHYYKCYGRKTLRACDKAIEQKSPLEKIVVSITVKHVLTDENVERIAAKAHELMVAEANDNAIVQALESRLSEVKKAISNLLKAIEAGIFTDTTKERLVTLENEKNELTVQIEKEKIAHPIFSKERIMFWLESFKHGDVDDVKYRRQIIDTLIHSVFVYDEDGGTRLRIVYNMSENNEISYSCSDIGSAPPLVDAASNTSIYIIVEKMVFVCEIRIDR